jgi:hypothetical protein
MLINGESHLRQILSNYATYFTTARAHTSRYKRMRRCSEQSNGLVPSLLSQSRVDRTMNTCGYDFRTGQPRVFLVCNIMHQKRELK